MKKQIRLLNSNKIWSSKLRYRVNDVVTYNGVEYQNITGVNSLPTDLIDWISLSSDGTSLYLGQYLTQLAFETAYPTGVDGNFAWIYDPTNQHIDLRAYWNATAWDYLDLNVLISKSSDPNYQAQFNFGGVRINADGFITEIKDGNIHFGDVGEINNLFINRPASISADNTQTFQNASGTIALQGDDNKVTVKLAEPITKGQAVYISGANGTNIIVSKASNTTEATSSKTLGVLQVSGTTNDIVSVQTFGLLSGVNTSAATIGDPVWLGISGNLIFGLASKPVAPAHLVYIGIVSRVHAVNGEIFVNVQNGFELNEIHDVSITSPAVGDTLKFDGSLWKNVVENPLEYFDNTEALINGILNNENYFVKSLSDTKQLAVAKSDVKPPYGYLYNKNSWTNITDFTLAGTAGLALSGSKLNFTTGTNGVFTNYATFGNYTGLEKSTAIIQFRVNATPTATSYGFGFGIQSFNTYGKYSICCQIGLSTGGTSLYISTMDNANVGTNRYIGTLNLGVNLDDIFEIQFTHDINKLIFKVTNITSGQIDIKVYSFTTSLVLLPNVGKFAIYNMGGSYEIQSIKVYSKEYKNAKLMCIGDSKIKGYFANNFNQSFVRQLQNNYGGIVNNSGGFDGTDSVLLKLPEIIAMTPARVLLNIGSNDKRQGMTLANWQTKYSSIVTQLTNAGIDVYHLLQFNESVLVFTDYNAYITATYPAGKIVNAGTITLNADGVHPGQTGHNQIYSAIVAQIGSIIT